MMASFFDARYSDLAGEEVYADQQAMFKEMKSRPEEAGFFGRAVKSFDTFWDYNTRVDGWNAVGQNRRDIADEQMEILKENNIEVDTSFLNDWAAMRDGEVSTQNYAMAFLTGDQRKIVRMFQGEFKTDIEKKQAKYQEQITQLKKNNPELAEKLFDAIELEKSVTNRAGEIAKNFDQATMFSGSSGDFVGGLTATLAAGLTDPVNVVSGALTGGQSFWVGAARASIPELLGAVQRRDQMEQLGLDKSEVEVVFETAAGTVIAPGAMKTLGVAFRKIADSLGLGRSFASEFTQAALKDVDDANIVFGKKNVNPIQEAQALDNVIGRMPEASRRKISSNFRQHYARTKMNESYYNDYLNLETRPTSFEAYSKARTAVELEALENNGIIDFDVMPQASKEALNFPDATGKVNRNDLAFAKPDPVVEAPTNILNEADFEQTLRTAVGDGVDDNVIKNITREVEESVMAVNDDVDRVLKSAVECGL